MRTAIAFAFCCAPALRLGAQLPAGAPAPALAFETVFEEDPTKLSELAGKLVLLDVTRTWCKPCEKTLPRIRALHARFAARGLVVVAVSDESLRKLEAYSDKHKLDYALVRCKKADRHLEVDGYPSFLLLEPGGKVLWSGSGADEQPDFDLVDLFLGGIRLRLELPESARYAAAREAWAKLRYGKAARELAAIGADPALPKSERPALVAAKQTVARQEANGLAEVKRLSEGPDFLAATQRLSELRREYAGLRPDLAGQKVLQRFKRDKTIRAEVAAMRELAKLRKRYGKKDAPTRRKLVAALRKFAGKHSGLSAGRLAVKLIDEVLDAGDG